MGLRLALPLLLLGIGAGAIITPNQALSLADVDPRMGGAAGGVLQTAQRIGAAIGQAVIGSVFFAVLAGRGAADAGCLRDRAVGVHRGDVVLHRRRAGAGLRRPRPDPPPGQLPRLPRAPSEPAGLPVGEPAHQDADHHERDADDQAEREVLTSPCAPLTTVASAGSAGL